MSLDSQYAQLTLDPSASPVLQRELPGLLVALDEQLMREYLGVLLGHADAGWSIASCELDQVTYAPDIGVALRYLLTLQDSAGIQVSEQLVTGRLFADQATCEAYLNEQLLPAAARMKGHDKLARFAVSVAAIEPLCMAVYVYPIDAELPVLADATDRQRMRAVFQETLPAALEQQFDVTNCAVELVDYGRQGRATLRYTIERTPLDGSLAQPQTIYGKLTADGSGALAGPLLDAMRNSLQRNQSAKFTLPRSFAWLDELQLSLLEEIPGEPRIASALKARLGGKAAKSDALSLEAMFDASAQIAAALHRSGIELGPRRSLEDELAAHASRLAVVERISPELGAELQLLLAHLATSAAASQGFPLVFNHGDFTFGQILFDGADSGLVDFDSVCQAEPALDLGHFLAYTQVASQKSKLDRSTTAELIEELSERFLQSYMMAAKIADSDAARLRQRVEIYRMSSLLRRAVRSWQKFKASRIESALAALEAAKARL
jgi:hypothetical protein